MRLCTLSLALVTFCACSFDSNVGYNNGQEVDRPDAAPPEGEVVGDCTPGDAPVCDGENLLECTDGGDLLQVPCALGCLDTAVDRCRFAVPRAPLESGPIDTATGSIDTSSTGSLIFDTDTGEITRVDNGSSLRNAGTGLDASSGIHFAIASQSQGPDIGVFSLAAIQVDAGDSIHAEGDNAFAALSAGNVIIHGVIDVDGGNDSCGGGDDNSCPGPGAGSGGAGSGDGNGDGPGAGGEGSDPGNGAGESGGGGGGFGSPGAPGGDGLSQSNGSVRADGGSAGNIVNDALLAPLRGGSGGGGGAREGTNYAECSGTRNGGTGGGGGGALQLFSRTRIEIADMGSECGIRASGGGGGSAGCGAGGGGGGSGGALLLEAPRVDMASTCFLVANGGAGSGGHESSEAEGGGMDGAAQASDGNSFVGNPSGDGGDGCYLGMPAEAGGNSRYQAGGGGGGDGRIRLHTAGGTSFFNTGHASPAPSEGSVSIEP